MCRVKFTWSNALGKWESIGFNDFQPGFKSNVYYLRPWEHRIKKSWLGREECKIKYRLGVKKIRKIIGWTRSIMYVIQLKTKKNKSKVFFIT